MGEASELDVVLGILRVAGVRRDRSYLERWATQLGIRELLDQPLTQRGAD